MSKYCPQCGQDYDGEAIRCPTDDAELRAVDGDEDPLVGELLVERFRLTEKIGSGGFGNVYRAVQLSMRREVAVKIMKAEFDTDDPHYDRFVREATLASSLRHPNIVSPIDFGRDSDRELTYLVMEYIEGIDLGELLDNRRLTPALALDILYQTCGGLSDAHRHGIIHRDLKPRNLRLSVVSDGSLQVKVLDLGIAKPKDADEDITHQDDLVGTTGFLAPEYIIDGDLAAYSDQYALGILFYMMLTGQKPFTGNKHQILFQHVQAPAPPLENALPLDESPPDEIEQLYQRMAAKQPAKRFDDVRSVRECIDDIRDRHGIDSITISDPPELVSADIFEPWLAETAEIADVEVEPLPSDVVSKLRGAGAEVVTGNTSGRRKRIVLPTPPPLPAHRTDSSSDISLPKPGSLPTPGKKAPSRDHADSGDKSGPSLSLSKSDSAEANSSSPTAAASNRAGLQSRLDHDDESQSPPALPSLHGDESAAPPSQLADDADVAPLADDADVGDIPALDTTPEPVESATSDDAFQEVLSEDGDGPDLSPAVDSPMPTGGGRQKHLVIGGAVALIAVVATAGVALTMFTGDEEQSEATAELNPEIAVQNEPDEQPEEVPEDDVASDDDTGPSQEEMEQFRRAARDAGQRLAGELAVPQGQKVAEQIEDSRAEEARAPTGGSTPDRGAADEGEDDLDRLLEQVGRP